MLSNAYFLAQFRFDTAENEPAKNLTKFTKNCKICRFCSRFVRRAAAFAAAEAARASESRGGGLGVVNPGVVANFWQNFGKISLVFGCIGADLC